MKTNGMAMAAWMACALMGCEATQVEDPTLDSNDQSSRYSKPSGYWRNHTPPDLGTAADSAVAADLAEPQASPDLATAPDLQTAPDLATPTALPTVTGVSPALGPAGTVIVVAGAGFESGDAVQLQGNNLAPVRLAVLSITAGAITATVPSLNVGAPASLQLTVVRDGAQTAPIGYQYTAGRIWYVAPGGSNSAAGTISSPLATIGGAAARMAPGDVAYLRGGTYNGSSQQITASGTATAPLTFAAYPGEQPLLTASSGSSDMLTVSGSHIVLDHLRMTNNMGGQVVYIQPGGTDITIQYCEIFNSKHQGLLNGGDYNKFLYNSIHDNGGADGTTKTHGFYCEGAGNVIRHNRIYNNFTFGLQLYRGYTGAKGGNIVEYNYIYHNGYGAYGVNSSAASAGMVIAYQQPNNIVRYNRFCDNAQYGLYLIDNQPGNTIVGNVSCFNRKGGFNLLYPGSGNNFNNNISYNDSAFALRSSSGVTSDNDDFFSSGSLNLVWSGRTYTSLGAFQQASGQDAHSTTTNPGFKNVPLTSFDYTQAASYDFCNSRIPQLCNLP